MPVNIPSRQVLHFAEHYFTAFLMEGNPESKNILAAFITKQSIIPAICDLLHSLVTSSRQTGNACRIFHLDDNARVRIVRFNGNVTEAIPRLCVGHDVPVWIAAKKPQQDAMIEVFLLRVLRLGVQHADHLTRIEVSCLRMPSASPLMKAVCKVPMDITSLFTTFLNHSWICRMNTLQLLPFRFI